MGTELRNQDLNDTDENEEIYLKEKNQLGEWQERMALQAVGRDTFTEKIW